MPRIIVNADDFGLSHEANIGIAEAFEKGFITNTTLMVNMPFCEEAVQLAKENGFWNRVGLHLNIYEGKPLNPAILRYKEFGNADGTNLLGDYRRTFIKHFYLERGPRTELKKELECQIQKFLSYQPECMHVDSHGHSHTNWSVFRECKPLFIKYGFQSTRLSRNLYPKQITLKDIYKTFYNSRLLSTGLYAAELFGSFTDMRAVLEQDAGMLENKTIELMCHPLKIDGRLINLGKHPSFEEMDSLIENMEKSKY